MFKRGLICGAFAAAAMVCDGVNENVNRTDEERCSRFVEADTLLRIRSPLSSGEVNYVLHSISDYLRSSCFNNRGQSYSGLLVSYLLIFGKHWPIFQSACNSNTDLRSVFGLAILPVPYVLDECFPESRGLYDRSYFASSSVAASLLDESGQSTAAVINRFLCRASGRRPQD